MNTELQPETMLTDGGVTGLPIEEVVETDTGTNKKKDNVGAFRMFCWQTRLISTGVVALMLGSLSLYCTDFLKIPAALVGILLMSSKIVDSVTDLLAGYLVDRTNTKIGRGRPYELMILGLWACTWLLFSCPTSFSLVVKCIWVFMMYTMVQGIFATFLNANNNAYMVRAFSRHEHYVAISSYGSIIVMFGIVIFNVVFPITLANVAVSASGWSRMVAMFAIPLVAIGLLRFIFIPETHVVKDEHSGSELKLKDLAQALKSNRYIWIIGIWILVYNIITNMGVNMYYYKYILNDLSLMSIASLATIIVLPVMIIVPKILKKIPVGKFITYSLFLTAIGYLLTFVAYKNFPLILIGGILIGAGNVPANMLLPLLIIDNAEFNEWRGEPRLEGSMSGVTSFAGKLGSALGVFLLGVMLTMSGYDKLTNGVLPDSALIMIRMLFTLIPMVSYLIVGFMMTFYKLDAKILDIRKDNEQRRAEKEIEGTES